MKNCKHWSEIDYTEYCRALKMPVGCSGVLTKCSQPNYFTEELKKGGDMSEKQAIVEVEPKPVTDIVYQPDAVMKAAINASKALQEVVSKKPKPVRINGEQYLEFEDWQTCGRFYGVTAKALSADLVEIDGIKGFKATAVAMKDGVEISGAVAYCMRDEKNWETKPMFQLASMAQTRAAAKALRNVLAWVVVLAGYKATPAEEMTPDTVNNGAGKKHYDTISEKQAKRLYAIAMGSKIPNETVKTHLLTNYGVESSKEIKPEWYDDICDWAKNWIE